jgi:hypothetical protein
MDRNKYVTAAWLILAIGLLASACGEDDEAGTNPAGDNGDKDGDKEVDSDTDGTDEGDGTDTAIIVSTWPCPEESWPENYKCLSSAGECDGLGGVVSDSYICEGSGGAICCDMTPLIIVGDEPCPEDQPGISCQISWECYKISMSLDNLLYEDYFCEGDNNICCLEAPDGGVPDGGEGPDDGE